MTEVLLFATIISPIIIALLEALKRTFNINKRYIPMASIFIGVLVGIISSPFSDLDIQLRMWSGLLSGLSAVGLFELIKPERNDKNNGTVSDGNGDGRIKR